MESSPLMEQAVRDQVMWSIKGTMRRMGRGAFTWSHKQESKECKGVP